MDQRGELSDTEEPGKGESKAQNVPGSELESHTSYEPWSIVKYGNEHQLQDMMIHVPEFAKNSMTRKFWLVFIHGGGWRDPDQTREGILPAFHLIYNDPNYALPGSYLHGIASVNYALSSYPGEESFKEGRGYHHPQHISDVCRAVKYLADKYGMGRDPMIDWIAVGHSCGATMAFQIAMGIDVNIRDLADARPPLAVVGTEGLYDLSATPYPDMLTRAFGPNPNEWERVSPAKNRHLFFSESWRTRYAFLGHSKDDSLVEWQQSLDMYDTVRSFVGASQLVELAGDHDDIWRKGHQLAGLIGRAVNKIAFDFEE
jgi:acetyl esterase/lipase